MENFTNYSSINALGQLPPQVWGVPLVIAVIGVTVLIAALIIWTLVWKGLALWKAARHGSKWWFIILLVINTAGLLDIIYYFLIDKRKK